MCVFLTIATCLFPVGDLGFIVLWSSSLFLSCHSMIFFSVHRLLAFARSINTLLHAACCPLIKAVGNSAQEDPYMVQWGHHEPNKKQKTKQKQKQTKRKQNQKPNTHKYILFCRQHIQMLRPKQLFVTSNSTLNVPFCSKLSRKDQCSYQTASI